ncbi:bacterial low temperature requirement A protein-domain-containing protein [Tricladium varicosporioides]|nr:bacterial low temperature requirement A protein-domain-containing protein [Hymenoscyphus varicosporioides]
MSSRKHLSPTDSKRGDLLTSSSTSSLKSLTGKSKNSVDLNGHDRLNEPKLKLFESPLAHERRGSFRNEAQKPDSFINISGPLGISPKPSTEKLPLPNIYNDRSDDKEEYFVKNNGDSDMRETPEFRRYEEATNIELFYDLFFVANLTTFTEVTDINSSTALKSYAGFFCILWFLWVQVSLFDVRFVTDSILERVGKAAQFGVMVGLASVGPNFDPSSQKEHTFRSLAIILMFSRVILGLQYAIVLYHVWFYRNSKTPLVMVVGTNFVAALIYLGTLFAFKKGTNSKVYIVWYVTAILETTINVTISANWKVLSFEGSHLVQRMSLLTLIILGEGVIGICKSISTIVETEAGWTAPLVVTVVAAVTLLYFIYMIYFDWMNRAQFGTFRQELWAFLHFPFHLALVLLVEGTAQFIIWRKIAEVVARINTLFSTTGRTFLSTGDTNSVTLSTLFVNATNTVYAEFPPKFARTIYETQNAIHTIGNATFNSTEQSQGISTLFSVIRDSIFDSFNIEPPEKKMKRMAVVADDPNDEWERHMEAFKLIFVYFFIASGLTLILMNILNTISRPKTTRGDRIRICVYFVFGVLLASVASLVTTDTGFGSAQSAIVLPTVALVFVFVMTFGYTKLL